MQIEGMINVDDKRLVHKQKELLDKAVEDLRTIAIFNNSCAFCAREGDCAMQSSNRTTVETCWEWRGLGNKKLSERCEEKSNEFRVLNKDTAEYSGIEIAIHPSIGLRVRVYDNENIINQDVVPFGDEIAESLRAENAELKKRLCVGSRGGDKIDELEECMADLKHLNLSLKIEIAGLRAERHNNKFKELFNGGLF